MLEIKDLHATRRARTTILKGIDLTSSAGEVHAIMGPNGSGKSTLAQRAGGPRGLRGDRAARSLYEGKDLLELAPEERAREGVFLAFQYPVEIPGVDQHLLPARPPLNAIRKHRGEEELDAIDFLDAARRRR